MKLFLTLGAAALAAGAANEDGSSPIPERVTGTVTGRVVFEGEKPEIKPLTISADQAKGCHGDGSHVDDANMTLVIADDGGIQFVAVTLDVEGAEEVPVPEEPIVVDQSGCRFVPHLVVVPVGSTIAFGNSDDVSHNLPTYPIKHTPLNQTVAAGNRLEQKMEKAEEVKVGCDIHPWMASYIVVTEASHYATTDASGAFELSNVPAGEHEIEVWHETLGKGSATVTVAEDGSSEPVEITLGEKKKRVRRGR
jgi:plastocyanin